MSHIRNRHGRGRCRVARCVREDRRGHAGIFKTTMVFTLGYVVDEYNGWRGRDGDSPLFPAT
jgi:hypothetical protein